jgi:GNAT superfamily N-acetyltransferase
MKYLVARIDESLVSFASYMYTTEEDMKGRPRECLYLYELQVDPNHRGQGIGTAMLNQLEQWAQAAKIPIILTCFKHNQDAMRFYRKLGYRPDQTSPSQCGYSGYDYEILYKRVA